MTLPNDFKLSIQDAADRLGVSTKTLRRWETKGLITPERTVGNQRRYSISQLDSFSQQHTQIKYRPSLPITHQLPKLNPAYLKPLVAAFFMVALPLSALGIFSNNFLTDFSQRMLAATSPSSEPTKVLGNFDNLPLSPSPLDQILGDNTIRSQYVFNVNVPAAFNDLVTLSTASVSGSLTVQGDIINPSLITGLIAGEDIEVVRTGQTATIRNLSPASSQKIYQSFKLGDDTIAAGSATDIFEFVAGGTTTLSLDTDNKKLTITGATPDYTESGWTEGTNKVTLTTIGDNVGIGTANPNYKLEVTGTGYFSDTLTAANGLVVTDTATFNNSTTITGSLTVNNSTATNTDFNIAGTGDLTISDSGTAFITFSDNGNITLANDALLDLSNVTHDDSAAQGFRLPQADTLTGPSSGEGYLAWDSDDDSLKVFNGTVWADVAGSGSSKWTDGGTTTYLTANDNIGIGTTSASQKLEVAGTIQATGLKITTSPTDGYVLTSDASGTATWQAASGGTIDGSGTANYLSKWSDSDTLTSSTIFDTGTNLGLGTTDPAQKLDVVGTTKATGFQLGSETVTDFSGTGITVTGNALTASLGTSIETAEITNDTILEIDLDSTNAPTDNYILSFDNASGGFTWIENTGGGGGGIDGSGTGNFLSKWSDSDTLTDSLLYDDGTNLGLGTTAPSTNFEVATTARFSGSVAEAAQSKDRIDIGVENGTPRMVFEDSGNTIWEIDNSAGTFRWYTPGVERLTLDGSGNLDLKTGGLELAGTSVLTSGRALQNLTGITSSGTITYTGLGTGTDNSVVVLNSSNQLTTDEIDPRAWGSTLLDDTDIGSTVQAYDADTSTIGQTIETAEITDDEILEVDLDITNSPTDNYMLTYDSGSAGFTWVDPATAGAIDGSGTGNYVTRWSDGNTLTSSILYDTGTNLGLGTTAPSTQLHLTGDLTIAGGDLIIGGTNILSGGDTTSLNNIDAINATTETTLEAALDIAGDLTGTGLSSVTLDDNVVDDAELVNALTYSGTLTLSNALTLNTVSADTDNTVLILNSSNAITSDEIDSRVWGSTLLDDTDIGTNVQAYNANTSILGSSIDTTEITNDSVLEIDFDVTNSPTDNYVLTYDSASGGFTWTEDAVGGGGLFTDGGTTSYLTSLTDDLAIGGTGPEAPFFINESESALTLNPFGASSGNTGELRLTELVASGTNYTGFKSPDALGGNVVYTLPTADGSASQVLSTDSNGVLAWIDVSAGAGGGVWSDGGTYVKPTNNESMRVYDSGGSDYLDIAHNGTNANLTFSNTTLFAIDTSDLVLELSSGNLGLGTTAPSYLLDIQGTAGFSSTIYAPSLGADTDNSVVVLNSSGLLKTDEIDSRVWGSTLLDDTDIGVSVQAYDANTSTIGQTIETAEITNDTILEIDLDLTNDPTDNYMLTFDNSSGGFTWVDPTTAGVFDGSGTANYLTKFTDSDTLTSSVLYEASSNIGIGTTDPSTQLHLSGDLTIAGGDLIIGSTNILSGGDTTSLNNIDVINATTEATLEAALDIAGDLTGTGLSSVTIDDNVIDDAELVNSLTYSGTLSLSNVAASTDNTVLLLNSSNQVIQDEIDSRVWGSSLVDGSSLTAGYLTKASDSDTITNSNLYDNGTNLGIGTTAPTTKFEVNGHTRITGGTSVSWPTSGYGVEIAYDSNSTIMGGSGMGYLFSFDRSATAWKDWGLFGRSIGFFYGTGGTNSEEAMRISTTGNIGLGTTAPGYKLEVTGTGYVSGAVTLGSTLTAASLGTGTDNSVIVLNGSNQLVTDEIDSRVWGSTLLDDTDINSTVQGYDSSTSLLGQTIESGEISDDTILEAKLDLTNSPTDNYILSYDSGTTGFTWVDPATAGVFDGSGTANYLTKFTDSDTLTSSVLFDNGTNIGLGTTAPGYKLEVVGTAGFSSTIYAPSLGADTDNSVVVLNSSGLLKTDEIDSRVWGSTLLDDTDINSTVQGYDSSTSLLGQTIESGEISDDTILEAKLDLTNSPTDNYILSYDSGTTGFTWVDPATAGVFDGSGTANYLTKFTDSDTLTSSVLFDNGTNIGLGTTAPGYKLEVTGTGYVSGAVTLGSTLTAASLGTGTDNSVIVLNGSNQLVTDEIDSRVWGSTLVDGSSLTAGYLTKTSDSDTITNSLLYDNGTNVGVGTTAPDVKLDVYGMLRVTGSGNPDYPTTGEGFEIGWDTNGTSNMNMDPSTAVTVFQSYDRDETAWRNLLFRSKNIEFDTNNNTAMVINTSGNVGIGTTLPQYKLEVTGTGYVSGAVTLGSTLTAASLGTGTDNSVIVLNGSNQLVTDEIDSRVWGSTLLDDTDINSTVQGYDSSTSLLGQTIENSEITDDTILEAKLDLTNSPTDNYILSYDSGTTGFTWVDPATAGVFDGSGTANYLTKFTDSDTLTSSVLFDNGTNIGLGTTAPGYKLEVVGTAGFSSTIYAPSLGADTDNSVVVLNSSGLLKTDEIDSRVWGSTLLDDTDIGVNVQSYNANTTLLGQTIESGEISDDTILEAKLDLTNSPTDNYILSYDSGTTGFTWVANDGGSGASLFTDGGNITYLTSLTDDLGIGGTGPEASLFFDESASALTLNPFGASAGNTGELRLTELVANGTNYTGFKAADALAGNVIYTLPTADGSANQILSTDSNGVLSWIDISAGAGGVFSDGGSYVKPTNNESVRIYDSGGTDYMDIAHDGTNANITFNNTGLLTFDTSDLVIETSSGNIGIGTTDPNYKLQVTGTGYVSGAMTLGSTLTAASLGTGTDNSVIVLNGSNQLVTDEIDSRVWGSSLLDGSGLANQIAYYSDADTLTGSNALWFDGTNIGIGTTDPSNKLHLNSGRIVVGSTDIGNVTTGVSTYGTTHENAYGYQAGQSATRNITFGWIANSTDNNAYGYMETYAGNNDLLIQRSGGNVGIGLSHGSYPSAKLDVVGTAEFSSTISAASIGADTDNSVVILNSSGLLKTDEIDSRVWGSTLVDYSSTTASYLPKLSDADTITNSLLYDNGTNLGLGTTAPTDKLHVAGNIFATAGLHIGADGDGTLIDDASTGSSSTTLYIGNESILVSGDIGVSVQGYNANTTLLGQTIENSEITDDTILEAKLDLTNSPTDNYILSYDSGTTGFTWVDPATAGVFDGSGTANYLTKFTDADTLTSSVLFDNGTNLGLGTTAPSAKLDVVGTAEFSSTISAASIGADTDNSVVILNSSGLLKTDEIDSRVWGSTLVDYSSTTASYLPKLSDADTITNSLLYDDGTNIGLGTTAPTYKLQVQGTSYFSNTLTANATFTNNGQFTLGDGGDTGTINTSDWDIGATGDASGFGAITADGTITFSGVDAGTDNSVLVLNSSNQLVTDEIDSRVWGNTLVDGSSLTASYLTRVSDSDTIINSLLYDTGTNIGLGTTAPSQILDIIGNFELSGLIDANGSGTHDIAGTLNLSGNTLKASGDLTLDPTGQDIILDGDLVFNDTYTLQIGGLTSVAYNAFANSGEAPEEAAISADNDVYIGGDLEIDGTLYANLSGNIDGSGTASYVSKFSDANTLTDSVVFDDGTNLGIGTTDPSALLDIVSGSGNSHFYGSYVELYGSTGSVPILKIDQDGAADILRLQDGGADVFVVKNGGNVGIGTTGPSQLLEISKNQNAVTALSLSNTTSGTAARVQQVYTAGSVTGAMNLFSEGYTTSGSNIAASLKFVANSTATGGMNFVTGGAYDISFWPNDARAVTIKSGGNVGIGTTNPGYKLEVNGTLQADDIYSGDGTQGATTTTGGATFKDGLFVSGTIASAWDDIGNPDANTTINLGTYTTQFDFTGTTTTGWTYNADSLTTGTGQLMSFDALTSGTGLSLSSTSTALTTGKLMSLDWSPTAATTATGDLFNINIGSSANIGNLINITDSGTSLFSVSETAITSAIPHSFTASGDVSMAYDLIFTNQTSSKIESYGPFTIEAGESFENNDLTLKTYGTGALVVDAGGGSEFTRSGNTVATFDRTTSDGTIISLKQAGSEEGTISVSTTTVSYNAFTGSHYAWSPEILENGYLVSLTDDNKHLHDNPQSEVLYGITETDTANDSKVMGVYLDKLEGSKPHTVDNPKLVMAVGNGDLWVADTGKDIKSGDYLISSSIPGHAQKDSDQLITSYIVARAGENIAWDEVDETLNKGPTFVKHKKISVFFESFVINRGAQTLLTTDSDGQLVSFKDQTEADISNQLAKITDLEDLYTNILTEQELLTARVDTLEDNVASQSAQIASLSTQTDFLEDIINTLLTASASATLTSNFTLDESTHATISALMVTNDTILNNLGITGDITAGLLKFNGLEAEINTIGLEPLKLQSHGLAEVQIMNEKVIIDTKGKLSLAGDLELEGAILGSDSIRGIDVLVATDSAELVIEFPEPKDTNNYAVSITPNWPAYTWVTDKTIDDFTINFSETAPFDATIDWIIIE